MEETKVVKHLLQGFCNFNNAGSTYYIPSFDDKDSIGPDFIMDLIIFEITETMARGKKLYEGYLARITLDILQNENVTRDNDTDSWKLQLIKAVNHQDGFYVQIDSGSTSPFLYFYSKDKDDHSKTFCRAPLIRVDIAVPAGQLLETTLISLERASETCLKTKSISEDLDDQQKKLERKLNELVVEKNRMEDRMLRSFTVAMNAQKEGYRKLYTKYLALVERLKIMGGINEDEPKAIIDKEDSESESDYDMETDVEDNEPDTENAGAKRRKVVRISDDAGSESEGLEDRSKTGIVKNLFNNNTMQKSEDSTSPKRVPEVEESSAETDFAESSQEIFIPKAKRPTNYKSPFKVSNASKEDETSSKKVKEMETERKEDEVTTTAKKALRNTQPSTSTRSKAMNSLKLLSSVFPDSQ